MKDFAIIITTHGRPDKQYTLNVIRKAGYTGKIILLADDEDETLDRLRSLYGEMVTVFSKQECLQIADTGTSVKRRNIHLYARIASEEVAKMLELKTFVMADDDITNLRYRYIEDGKLKSQKVTQNLDRIIEQYTDFMVENDMPMISIGMAQMYFAGIELNKNLWKWRIPYTFIFRNVKHPIEWKAEFQEESVTAIEQAIAGKYCMVAPFVQHDTLPIGNTEGGMSEAYHSEDSCKTSEFGHIWHPTAEIVRPYKGKFMSTFNRENAFPRLISSCFKK